MSEARQLVREELARAGRPDLVETAELLVSEVVTNALVHAGTPIRVSARVDLGTGLRVEVSDGSAVQPSLRHHASLAGTGRGLRMLQQMVDRWGARPDGEGKTVWFELENGDHELQTTELDQGAAPAPDAPGEDQVVEVELLGIPLLLHVAWHQHAEALLREYLLVRIGDEPLPGDDGEAEQGRDDLEVHAAASDAMALLFEQLPDPGFGEDAEELMATAVEPAVSSTREVVRVPLGSVPHFRILNDTLDEALELADAGAFLTNPTQPEIRAFRRWMCREVSRQALGAAPLPWDGDLVSAPAPKREPLDWSGEEVSAASGALVAADDIDRIVAVSPSALVLLGYDDAADLVGRRLVEIIPPRFRQAHLAGFTLHFSTGRSPLLGRPVTVPVLLRDGTEQAMELLVETRHLPGGRRFFVATLGVAETSEG